MKIINDPQNIKNYNLEKEISESQDCKIQFSEQVSNEYLGFINDLLIKYKFDIRFYSYNGLWREMSFLKLLTNLKKITIDEPLLENIEQISNLKQLKSLSLGYTRKEIDLKPISSLDLSDLCIEGNKKYLENIIEDLNIERLRLWTLSLRDLRIITKKKLKQLELNKVKFDSYEDIGIMQSLTELHLHRLSNIHNLSFISRLINLHVLDLSSLSNCSSLFDFSKLKELEWLGFDSLSKLTTLENIDESKKLNRIYIYNCKKINKTEFSKLKNIKEITIE